MSDVSKVLIAQLKMAYIHNDIDTCDLGQVCKSCGQNMELHEVYKLGKPGEKIISIDGLIFFHIKYPATEPALMVYLELHVLDL